MEVNEAIIDVEIGIAEFEGRNVPGFMPVLGCPVCNNETMEYAGDLKSARRALSSIYLAEMKIYPTRLTLSFWNYTFVLFLKI